MKAFFTLLAFACALVLPSENVFAQTKVENTGFVSSVIWYSRDPFLADEKIRVYTLVFNANNETLRGTVVFADGDTTIGEYAFSIAGNQAKDISIPWTPKAGPHSVKARIENAELVAADGTVRTITLSSHETPASVREAKLAATVPQTAPAKLIEAAGASAPVQAATAVIGSGIAKAESLLPAGISVALQTGIAKAEDARKEAVLGLQTSASKNEAKPSLEGFKETPFAAIGLFATTTAEAILRYPLFAYGAAFLLLLWLLRSIRKWRRGF